MPKNYMPIIGGVILLLVVVYFVFQGVDNLGLTSRKASAVVIHKNYRDAGMTYTTQMINNRPQVIPQGTAEVSKVYLLELEIDGERVGGAVSKEIFDMVSVSQRVEATYERRRLTGTPLITKITQ